MFDVDLVGLEWRILLVDLYDQRNFVIYLDNETRSYEVLAMLNAFQDFYFTAFHSRSSRKWKPRCPASVTLFLNSRVLDFADGRR